MGDSTSILDLPTDPVGGGNVSNNISMSASEHAGAQHQNHVIAGTGGGGAGGGGSRGTPTGNTGGNPGGNGTSNTGGGGGGASAGTVAGAEIGSSTTTTGSFISTN